MKQTHKTKVSYIEIDEAFSGQRIDNFLINKLKNVPKTRIYRILRKGEVRVNKKRAAPSYRLETGDSVRIPPLEVREEMNLTAPPREMQRLLINKILYEDSDLLIINKPAGIAVHGGSKTPWGVIEILRSQYPQYPHLELGHRLDLDTSGCLILAKKRSVLRQIHELLRSGQVKKQYWALTLGNWKQHELKVEVALRKNILSSGERIVCVDRAGKPSTTIFTVIKKFKHAAWVNAQLLTGRTHQIRVHAQYRGHPIAGDEKYGNKEFNKLLKEKGLNRLFLHAHSVEFTLASGQKIKVQAPLMDDLERILKNLPL